MNVDAIQKKKHSVVLNKLEILKIDKHAFKAKSKSNVYLHKR